MKTIINFVVGMWLIFWALAIIFIPDIDADITELRQYSGYMVTDKNDVWYFPQNITLRKDTMSHTFICEDIIFNDLQVGDIIW